MIGCSEWVGVFSAAGPTITRQAGDTIQRELSWSGFKGDTIQRNGYPPDLGRRYESA